MTDAEFVPILEAVIAKTGHEPFRAKCDPTHSNYRPGMREAVIALHEGRTVERSPQGNTSETRQPIQAPYPPFGRQVANAAGAAARYVKSGGAKVSDGEAARRLAICAGTDTTPCCDAYDLGPRRCKKCGCGITGHLVNKVELRDEVCPVGKW